MPPTLEYILVRHLFFLVYNWKPKISRRISSAERKKYKKIFYPDWVPSPMVYEHAPITFIYVKRFLNSAILIVETSFL